MRSGCSHYSSRLGRPSYSEGLRTIEQIDLILHQQMEHCMKTMKKYNCFVKWDQQSNSALLFIAEMSLAIMSWPVTLSPNGLCICVKWAKPGGHRTAYHVYFNSKC